MITILSATTLLVVGVLIIQRQLGRGYDAPLTVAVLTRLCLCLIGTYVSLPFGGEDGRTFEQTAYFWSLLDWGDLFRTFDVSRSYVFSSMIAVLYKILDRDMSIPIFLNGIFGIMLVDRTIALAHLLWGDRKVTRAVAWVAALHPMLAVNSAIVLRESVFTLFLVTSSIFLVRYFKRSSSTDLVMFFGFSLVAAFFHGGAIFYMAGAPMAIVFYRKNTDLAIRVLLAATTIGVVGAFLYQLDINKLSFMTEASSPDAVLDKLGTRREAGTAYLENIVPRTPLDLVWQAPLRAIFLVAKPFPWDVRFYGDAIVMLDAFLWCILIGSLVRFWKITKVNSGAVAIVCCLILALVAFGYGTGNYGTGVRHRSKFIPLALAVAAPCVIHRRKFAQILLAGKKGAFKRAPQLRPRSGVPEASKVVSS